MRCGLLPCTAVAVGLLCASAASAQPQTDLACHGEADPAARLACYESVYKKISACTGAAAADRLTCYDLAAQRQLDEGSEPPRSLLGWKLRDKVSVNGLGEYAAEKTGAKLELNRTKGNTASVVKLAGLYLGPAVGPSGWNPFVGLGWKRDTSDPAKRSDSRELTVGITGAAGTSGSGRSEVDYFLTFLGVARHKLYKPAHEHGLAAHGDLYVPSWNYSSKALDYAVVPNAGLWSASLNDEDPARADGVYWGGYVGLRFEVKPKKDFPRWTVSGRLQAYADAGAPATAEKRRVQRGTLTVRYDLADPEAKRGWVPAIALTLERGLDPVADEGPARKVGLAFTVRYN